jgi:hypothetical protein
MYSAYSASLIEFVNANPAAIIGQLNQAIANDGFSRQWNSQIDAWNEEIAILQSMAGHLIQSVPGAQAWTVLLEYEIARRGRRVDAILLIDRAVIVIEFKVGVDRADGASSWQVYEYALDLRDFHAQSAAVPIVPILVPTATKSTRPSQLTDLTAKVHHVIDSAPGELASTIAWLHQSVAQSVPVIDQDAWRQSSYRPSLNIIEAAEQVFAGHEVREISHATATNLTATVTAVIRVIRAARQNHQRVVCFVTGVPGAGKTLAGLSAVHDPELREDDKPAAVFLSGNGPLVKIVRAALVRDMKRRGRRAKEGAREVSTFIQNVHAFLNHYAFKASSEVPSEHVVIFDEAQRAWDGERMTLKKRGSQSEAELMLAVMTRCPGWSVIVALIGFGQEIHQGEAGLQEWGRAIRESSPAWAVVASPSVLSPHADEDAASLFDDRTPFQGSVEADSALHLTVSIRSSRARMVGQGVRGMLEGNWSAAAIHFANNGEFPVVLTRDLNEARKWLRSKVGEIHRPGACGLLASSGALRLRAHGIEVSSAFRQGYPYEEWFLRDAGDVRSSSTLEVAATEFECQGLELDWVGVCWAEDLIYDAQLATWNPRRFVGARWQNVAKLAARQFVLNKYRVLLTRARKGLAIWVPHGSDCDGTRDRKWADSTAEFLSRCGVQNM